MQIMKLLSTLVNVNHYRFVKGGNRSQIVRTTEIAAIRWKNVSRKPITLRLYGPIFVTQKIIIFILMTTKICNNPLEFIFS